MSARHIPFSIYKGKSTCIIPDLQLLDCFKGLKDEFEIAVVNEPSVFDSLKFYCTYSLSRSHNNNHLKDVSG